MNPPAARPDSEETVRLLDRVRAGDRAAIAALIARHRDELRTFIDRHLDPAVRVRLDASDVVQDTLMKVADRLPDYLARQPMPFYLWARKTAHELMLNARRDHRAARRDVAREAPDPGSAAVADQIASPGPTPSQTVEARERADHVARAVAGLQADDRKILVLRRVDGLGYVEIAGLLDITAEAARQRYGRALVHLKDALVRVGVLGESS